MHIAIQGTKTAAEFKQLHDFLKKRAGECYEAHKKAVGDWQDGEPKRVCRHGNNGILIEYESGRSWFYNEKGDWQ